MTPHPHAITDPRADATSPAAAVVARGTCYALFAHDVGMGIDLAEADRLITARKQREAIKYTRRAPHTAINQPAPLRVPQSFESIIVGPFQTDAAVDAVLYDFGAISITFSIPLATPLPRLELLSDALYENPDLTSASRRIVERLIADIHPAINRPTPLDVAEDYAIYQVDELEGVSDLVAFLSRETPQIARILRSARNPLSPEEVADALACRISYEPADATIIDWNAAWLLGRDTEDVRTVLEFANVELLEMRFLDRQLDAALDQSYRLLSRRHWPGFGLFGSVVGDLRRIGRLQVDSALLFEGVTNALKLVGDQYLARVYRLASQRFHLAEWDSGIIRKLETLESIYSKISDRQINLRMEVLEWIIIFLIALELILPFARTHR